MDSLNGFYTGKRKSGRLVSGIGFGGLDQLRFRPGEEAAVIFIFLPEKGNQDASSVGLDLGALTSSGSVSAKRS